jgi:hypothetical protein
MRKGSWEQSGANASTISSFSGSSTFGTFFANLSRTIWRKVFHQGLGGQLIVSERMRTEAFQGVESVRWVRLPAIGDGCRPFAGQFRATAVHASKVDSSS